MAARPLRPVAKSATGGIVLRAQNPETGLGAAPNFRGTSGLGAAYAKTALKNYRPGYSCTTTTTERFVRSRTLLAVRTSCVSSVFGCVKTRVGTMPAPTR